MYVMKITELIVSLFASGLVIVFYMVLRRVEIRWAPWRVSKRGNLLTIFLRLISKPKIRK